MFQDPAEDTGHIGIAGAHRINKVFELRGGRRHLEITDKHTRAVGTQSKDKQHRIAVRPAVSQRGLQRPVGIQPGQVLVAELENIDMAHHPSQARDVAVAIDNQAGPHIRVERGHDSATAAIGKERLPCIGVVTVDEAEGSDMEQLCFGRHVIVKSLLRDLPFGGAVAVEGI